MSQIFAYKSRGCTHDFRVLDANSNDVVLGGSDEIRAVIGREGKLGVDFADAAFSITNGTNSANGSSFTKNGGGSNIHRLRLDASDLSFSPGVYSLFFEYKNAGDGNEWKAVRRFVFVLLET